jgi:hypothetical protein
LPKRQLRDLPRRQHPLALGLVAHRLVEAVRAEPLVALAVQDPLLGCASSMGGGRRLDSRVAIGIVLLAMLAACVALADPALASHKSHKHKSHKPRRPEIDLTSPEPSTVPLVSTATAVSFLNQQRIENGIAGDLTNDPEMDAGCSNHVNNYQEQIGQYPHEEVPGQPGYSELGNRAAANSDLAFRSGEASTDSYWWGPTINPWSGAAKHLSALFNPAATTTWYAESLHGVPNGAPKDKAWPWGPAACMGTSGSRAFSSPTFFSYPGGGATNVPYSEYTSEWPSSPQEDVGLPSAFNGGPAVILWAEGIDATLQGATLSAADGTVISTKLLANEPYGGGGAFVVPTTDLRPGTAYTLVAMWIPETGPPWERKTEPPITQVAHFTTSTQTLNEQVHAVNKKLGLTPEEGSLGGFSVRRQGHKLKLFAFGEALRHLAIVTVQLCPSRDRSSCDFHKPKAILHRKVRLDKFMTVVKLPHVKHDKSARVFVTMASFRMNGVRVTSNGTAIRSYRG